MGNLSMIRRIVLCLGLAISMEAGTATGQAQQTGKPFDVRAYLVRSDVMGMYREWISRERPRVIWGVGGEAPAKENKAQEDAAWRQIARAVRGIRRIKEDELEILVRAICLACRSGIEADDVLVQCRTAGEVERLCLEAQRRLIAHPEHYSKLPVEEIASVVAFKDIKPLIQKVTTLERRMSAKLRAAEAKGLARSKIRAEGATKPARQPSKHRPQRPVDVATSAPAESGRHVTVKAIERDGGNTIEGLLARSWRAMGMPASDRLDVVARRLCRRRPNISGEHNEAILLGKLVRARSFAVALRAMWETCKSAGRVPLKKEDFLEAARKVQPILRERFKNVPAQCLSPKWIWESARLSIALSQQTLWTPTGVSTTRPAKGK